MAQILLTAEGKKQLEERLHELKVKGRGEAAERIRIAREFGDLSENAEYDIAKEEQGKLEAEIVEIEQKLRNVVIIDEKQKRGDYVGIGSSIKTKELSSGMEFEYTIVGTHEANPIEGRISNESPFGRALIGSKKGEEITFNAPAGTRKYKILSIS